MKCVFFASLRSQKETFGGICNYVPTYFITEQGNLIVCCDLRETLRVTKSQNRYKICRMLRFITYREASMKGVQGSWT